jgi:hypothetical protein
MTIRTKGGDLDALIIEMQFAQNVRLQREG